MVFDYFKKNFKLCFNFDNNCQRVECLICQIEMSQNYLSRQFTLLTFISYHLSIKNLFNEKLVDNGILLIQERCVDPS